MSDLLASQSTAPVIPLWFRVWGTIGDAIRLKKDRRTYRVEILNWVEFLGQKQGTEAGANAILTATPIMARAYRQMIERLPGAPSRDGDKKRSATAAPATVRKKLAALRSIYNDLSEEGLINHNPFLKRLFPSVDYQKRPTEAIPFSKVWSVINAPGSPDHLGNHNYQPDCARIIRDRAMMAVMFAGALRRSEVVDIRVGAVRMSERGSTYLHLRNTKQKGDAIGVVAPWASEFLWAWHAERVKAGAVASDYLFCRLWRDSSKHLPTGVSDSALYLMTKEYFQLAGVDPELYSPHSARATSVTKILDQGVSHRDVQSFSRHASVAMVEHYDKRRTDVDDNPGLMLEFPKSTLVR